ncbi:MAG TPA: hypothetical protein VFV00_02150 [Acidimicrobiales bacterium]|nr:hypothetical protein [Acidimicrobiales bacterium]
MTKALTNVTTGSALSRAIADTDARSWVARQLRFERLLRSLEQESVAASANPSSD